MPVLGLRRTTRRVAAVGVAAVLGGSVGIGGAAGPAAATAGGCQPGSLVVTDNLDAAVPPVGSLRAAFVAANAAATPQTICVATTVVGPIILTTAGGGELVYSAITMPGLTVEGNGITIQAAPNSGIIDDTTSGGLTLDHVTLTGGNTGSVGGAVNAAGNVTITNSALSANQSAGRGGGVNAIGDVTVVDSALNANTAGFDGGGVCSFANVTVTSSTLSNNTASGGGDGGGVCAFGSLTVTNSTITHNSADGEGGGVDADGGLTLVYSTVVQNTASTGANLGFATLAAFGSVVALAQGTGANCAVPGTTNGVNFSDDASCGFAATETHPGVDPRLGALVNNGGATQTRLPQPAIRHDPAVALPRRWSGGDESARRPTGGDPTARRRV